MSYRLALTGTPVIETDSLPELQALLQSMGFGAARPGLLPAAAVVSDLGTAPTRRRSTARSGKSVVPPTSRGSKRADKQAAILELLARGSMKVGPLAAAMKMNVPALRYQVALLVKAGKVVADGSTSQRTYALAAAPRSKATRTVSRGNDEFEVSWDGSK